ncbi:coiled-coil domain-containing protein 125-like [Centruroides sculpturatus]|uniref:coiled-coil domain-containing protein 125-like n=1 Tax=Centruroides sculpturatus TaxID=218467 RepID=UPI000C6DE8A6|nr:coiled-coil domain-containing protein 125-like [Centruroides sculpturatus]
MIKAKMSINMSASSSISELEIEDNLLLGDLGYGSGLKPGGIPNFCTSCKDLSCKNKFPHFAYLCDAKDDTKRISPLGIHSLSSEYSDSANSEELCDLIEEERETFSLELKKIFQTKRNSNCFDTIDDSSSEKVISNLKEELKLAYEKIEKLSSDLEVTRKLLYGKYKASEVLAKQLNAIEQENKSVEKTIKNECSQLQKEVNSLQFTLNYTESQLTESQRNWLERYNSVAKENSELTITVKEQADAIKSLISNRMALSHERDELMVLLDAKERRIFQRSSSLSSEESNSEFTSLELSLLGACSCRCKNQEPCRCARAACSKQKHIIHLNKELIQQSSSAGLHTNHTVHEQYGLML